MVVIDALPAPLMLLSVVLFPEATAAVVGPYSGEIDASTVVFKFMTMIVFARWIYLAGKNLLDAGFTDLEFTPGWRIWWFAVPIACLFKPFQGMRELWNASHCNEAYDQGNGLVATWWGLWLLSRIVGSLAAAASSGPEGARMALLVQGVVDIALVAVVITMIRRIAAAQNQMSGPALEEVFA
ncbi:DUF4328 domain-containing protein [Sphingomonas sp. JC676]|uniref:DUF4328 domain-containing protein n=1 Tax=Sphingomonas sp. JC676 TaxID=2768065 RepID=UPI00223B7D68|nr:DUF4328 domain-containing protein [Sphingomonas sp. JC676]